MKNYISEIRRLEVENMALKDALHDVVAKQNIMDRMYDYELDEIICQHRLEIGKVQTSMIPVYKAYVDLCIRNKSLRSLISKNVCKIEALRHEYNALHSHDWYRPMEVEDYLDEILHNGYISGIKL